MIDFSQASRIDVHIEVVRLVVRRLALPIECVVGEIAGRSIACERVERLFGADEIAALPTAQPLDTDLVLRPDLAVGVGISFSRGVSAAADHEARAALAVRLGAVRLGVTRRLLAHAITHLSGRISGGEPTIAKQLLLGQIADVETTIEVARHTLRVAAHVPAAVAEVHERLTAIDWETAKLLGASGYVGASPARTAYVSRLVANCWVPQEVTP